MMNDGRLQMENNIGKYDIYNNIGELYDEIIRKLSKLAFDVNLHHSLNHHDINIDAETFYVHFLNKIKGWNLINQNTIKRNVKGIDLIDTENKIIVQVSSEKTHKKIQESLDKSASYQGFHFYFVAITEKYQPRNGFRLPSGIIFDEKHDILDVARIMQAIYKIQRIEELQEINDVFDKYWLKKQSSINNVLCRAFDEEKERNPSMKMDRLIKGILPKGHIVSRVRLVDTGQYEKPLLFGEAIQRIRQLNNNYPICLYGIGGLGKTVTLLSFQWDIPVVYIPVRGIEDGNGITDYIKKTTLNSIDNDWETFWKLVKCENTGENKFTIIIDGLNEAEEKQRKNLLKEIRNQYIGHPGVEIILSSRYDVSTELSTDTNQIELEQLSRQQITEYLREANIEIPHSDDQIWDFITTPLMLHLYTQSEHIFINNRNSYQSLDDTIRPREPKNPGSIVWNYLQSEILRCKNQNVAVSTLATLYIAPYVSFKFRSENKFKCRMGTFDSTIEEALIAFKEAADAHRIFEQIDDNRRGETIQEITNENYSKVLIDNLCIFYRKERQIEFMHQHFRDALTSIYIYIALIVQQISPDILIGDTFDKYVESFFIDLLTSEDKEECSWFSIWESYRKSGSNDRKVLEKMLQIYKAAFGNDISKVNFSGLDLEEVSLSGFVLKQSNADYFEKTKLSESTFFKIGHQGPVASVSWHPKDDCFLSASHDCSIRIWSNQGENTLLVKGKPHKLYIRSALWCPTDPDLVVSGGDDRELILWRHHQNRWHSDVIAKVESKIRSIAWSQDGKQIAFGTENGYLYVYSFENGLKPFQENTGGRITLVRFCHDGKIITGVGLPRPGRVVVWDNDQRNQPILLAVLSEKVLDADISPDGNSLIVITQNSSYLYRLPPIFDYDKIIELPKDRSTIWKHHDTLCHCATVRFAFDKCYCALIYSGKIVVYKGSFLHNKYKFAQVALQSIAEDELGVALCANWNMDCTKLIIGSRNGSVWYTRYIEDEATYDRLLPVVIAKGVSKAVRCSAWNHDGTIIAAGYEDNTVRIWDIRKKRCVGVFFNHIDSVKSVAWSKDEIVFLASGSDDGTVRIWNTSTKEQVKARNLCYSPINCLAWIENDKILACTDSGKIVLWDINSNQCEERKQHKDSVYSILVSSDGRYALSAGNDMSIGVWRLQEKLKGTKISSGHIKEIRSLAWGIDEKNVYSCGNDRTILHREFDLDTGTLSTKTSCLPKLHTNNIYSIALSGDRRYIISGSTDTNVGLWSTEDDLLVALGKSHEDFVWNVSASPATDDGIFFASCSSDGTIKIWDISNINEKNDNELNPIVSLRSIPNISVVDCNFTKAVFQSEEIKKLIETNGGYT